MAWPPSRPVDLPSYGSMVRAINRASTHIEAEVQDRCDQEKCDKRQDPRRAALQCYAARASCAPRRSLSADQPTPVRGSDQIFNELPIKVPFVVRQRRPFGLTVNRIKFDHAGVESLRKAIYSFARGKERRILIVRHQIRPITLRERLKRRAPLQGVLRLERKPRRDQTALQSRG